MVNLEVKGIVAKLLAQENLIVEHQQVQTAQFNVDTRVLTLPIWERATNAIFDLLVAHEVGHALYTPNVDPPSHIPHQFVNVAEDVRIEKMIKRRFPGLAKTFYKGYSDFHDMDFFSVEGEDFSKMSLTDRVNLHFKVGAFLGIKFSAKEQPIVQTVQDAETWDDVIYASELLYRYDKETFTDSKEENVPQGQEGASEQADQQPNESRSDSPTDSGDSDDTTSTSPGSSGGNKTGDVSDDSDSGVDTDSTPEPSVNTADSMDTRMRELINNAGHSSQYCQIPDIPLDEIIISNKEVAEKANGWWDNYYGEHRRISLFDKVEETEKEYLPYKKSVQKEVSYMVKEFECKKSADAYSRASTSRTGVLDCTKLHTYKYNEDLFKKVTTIPDGKNHGLIFILDWSGSMSHVLGDTVKQLFNLAWFCRKVNIPFRVYGFTNAWYTSDETKHIASAIQNPLHGDLWLERDFRLLEFLNSDANAQDFEKQCITFWNLGVGYHQIATPPGLQLSGTPLAEAVMCLHKIIPTFKKEKDLQKVHTIILTDGEAQTPAIGYERTCAYTDTTEVMATYIRSHYKNTYLRDPKLRTTYKLEEYKCVEALLRNLSDRYPEVSIIGIRLVGHGDFNRFMRWAVSDYKERERASNYFRKNKSVGINIPSYSKFFVLNQNSLNSETEFEVGEGAKKSEIRAAFKKSLTKSKFNRKILSEFVGLIA